MKDAVLLFVLFFASLFAAPQSGRDTLTIDASTIHVAALKPGTARYLVYQKNGKDSNRINFQLWTRKVDYVQHDGREAILVNQQWEDGDTIFHTVSSLCDRQTFLPLQQDSWWKAFGNLFFDFIRQKAFVQHTALLEGDTAAFRKRIYAGFQQSLPTYFLNWHLDLEVFSMLPFGENRSYRIRFYDPGGLPPQVLVYTVAGSGEVKEYDDRPVACWLLEHKKGKSRETYWISKQTKEVLKMEQEVNGKYRYKVKLPDSF